MYRLHYCEAVTKYGHYTRDRTHYPIPDTLILTATDWLRRHTRRRTPVHFPRHVTLTTAARLLRWSVGSIAVISRGRMKSRTYLNRTSVHIAIFSVHEYQHFGGSCCIHLQSRSGTPPKCWYPHTKLHSKLTQWPKCRCSPCWNS
jgi:hypothetical protein